MNIGMHSVCNQCAMTTPADLTLCVLYGRMSLRGSAGSCCYCVSCILTFSPNLLAALPHFITQQYGLSLIITYWFFIIINAVRVVYKASFEWAAEAQLHGTNAPCLWFKQGQRNQSPLIRDLQRETRIVHRRSRQSTQSGDFPLTCVHAASVYSLKTTRQEKKRNVIVPCWTSLILHSVPFVKCMLKEQIGKKKSHLTNNLLIY